MQALVLVQQEGVYHRHGLRHRHLHSLQQTAASNGILQLAETLVIAAIVNPPHSCKLEEIFLTDSSK